MTRETKIGLLVGLGFIVVFAVLLSHTDKTPPASMAQKVAEHMEAQSELYDPEASGLADWLGTTPDNTSPVVQTTAEEWGDGDAEREEADSDSHDAPASPWQPGMERPQPTRIQPRAQEDHLASIETFDPLPSDWYHRVTGGADSDNGNPIPAVGSSSDGGRVTTVVGRVAPQTVFKPDPSEGHAPPTHSSDPDEALAGSGEAAEVIVSADDPTRRVAPDQMARVRTESKTYIVQKGETLGEIASKVYGTVRAVSFLVEANPQSVRNKDTIVEGQTLLTPDWPGADQFEPVPNPGVPALTTPSERTVTMQNLLDRGTASTGRRAPMAVTDRTEPATAETPPQTNQDEPALTYTIQSKDTFCSIARNTLGSETLWREIQKVNPDLDPKKLRPGMTIKLPQSKPWNSVASSE